MLSKISFNTFHDRTMNQVVKASQDPSTIKRIGKLFVLNSIATITAAGATVQNCAELIGRTAITPVVFIGATVANRISKDSGQPAIKRFNAEKWLETLKRVAGFAAAIFTSLVATVAFNGFNIRVQENNLHTFKRPTLPPPAPQPTPDPAPQRTPTPIPRSETPPPPADLPPAPPKSVTPPPPQDPAPRPATPTAEIKPTPAPSKPKPGLAAVIDFSPIKPHEAPKDNDDPFAPTVGTPEKAPGEPQLKATPKKMDPNQVD